MRTKMSSASSSGKNHPKKAKDSSRDRDRSKNSESGCSSQCEISSLTDKDGGVLQGKFAGIGPDSITCMAEQIGIDINPEVATNLAEDASYKLRQMISTIALHSELMKKSRVDTWDVDTAFALADTSPAVGTVPIHYTQIGEEKLYAPVEELINVHDLSLASQTFVYWTQPSLSVEWVTDERSLNHAGSHGANLSAHLLNYYTKVARAILNLRKKPKEVAVADMMTNTRIGPIFPNLFNLAVLVLNDDNLNALNVPAKIPLQCNILEMVDALCSNPCSLDTNIQQQFQRLFPVMVSNILGNGTLSDRLVSILTKITRTWPSFITIGKSILVEYLSQGIQDRLTGPMIKCLLALGRRALVECLGDHLDYLDANLSCHEGLRETLLDVATQLLRSEPTTYLEDYVVTDYTLYEMLGDSIAPRRTIFPKEHKKQDSDKQTDEELSIAHRSYLRRPKIRIIPTTPHIRNGIHKEAVFEPTRYRDHCLRIKIKNCRTIHVPRKPQPLIHSSCLKQVVIASGLLHRFKYKLNKPNPAPVFGALLL